MEKNNGDCAACLKIFSSLFADYIYEMWLLRGRGMPVLYIGHRMTKGYESIRARVKEPFL